MTGTAEIFGTELVTSGTYTLTGTKAAIFTWHGCTFEVTGDALQSEYTAEETPMNEYVNLHFALETLRDQAKANGREGPRVLILGPEDAGKSSLAKILTGYASRAARSPLVVNLDVSEGIMSIPGTLTATVFKSLIDVEEGWGTAPMSGPNGAIPVKLPLVYYFGAEHPEEKEGKVYRAQISRLALAVMGRVAQDPEVKESGFIIDTPGSLTDNKISSNFEIIQHIVSEFSVSAIVCLGSERLYSDMVKRFDGTPVISRSAAGPASSGGAEKIAVVKLTKSGGCVDRDQLYLQAFRGAQIKSYFYGNARLSNGIALQPRQQQVDFNTLTVWRRITSASSTSATLRGSNAYDDDDDDDDDFLPGGLEEESTKVSLPPSQIYDRITNVQAAMRGSIFAVLNCDSEADQDELRDSSVMGFLYVTDTDEGRGRISLLSPVAGRVPNRALVWGAWPESILGLERS